MTSRAAACSDAIHKALFPRADAIHRMANSRRQIEEIIREHFPEDAGLDLLAIIDCGTNALIDSINCSGNDAVTNKHWVRKMRRDAGLDKAASGGPHPTSDPTHVAD